MKETLTELKRICFETKELLESPLGELNAQHLSLLTPELREQTLDNLFKNVDGNILQLATQGEDLAEQLLLELLTYVNFYLEQYFRHHCPPMEVGSDYYLREHFRKMYAFYLYQTKNLLEFRIKALPSRQRQYFAQPQPVQQYLAVEDEGSSPQEAKRKAKGDALRMSMLTLILEEADIFPAENECRDGLKELTYDFITHSHRAINGLVNVQFPDSTESRYNFPVEKKREEARQILEGYGFKLKRFHKGKEPGTELN